MCSSFLLSITLIIVLPFIYLFLPFIYSCSDFSLPHLFSHVETYFLLFLLWLYISLLCIIFYQSSFFSPHLKWWNTTFHPPPLLIEALEISARSSMLSLSTLSVQTIFFIPPLSLHLKVRFLFIIMIGALLRSKSSLIS